MEEQPRPRKSRELRVSTRKSKTYQTVEDGKRVQITEVEGREPVHTTGGFQTYNYNFLESKDLRGKKAKVIKSILTPHADEVKKVIEVEQPKEIIPPKEQDQIEEEEEEEEEEIQPQRRSKTPMRFNSNMPMMPMMPMMVMPVAMPMMLGCIPQNYYTICPHYHNPKLLVEEIQEIPSVRMEETKSMVPKTNYVEKKIKVPVTEEVEVKEIVPVADTTQIIRKSIQKIQVEKEVPVIKRSNYIFKDINSGYKTEDRNRGVIQYEM